MSILKTYSKNAAVMPFSQQGFVIFTTLIIMIIIGVLAGASLTSTESIEKLAGNSIQRGRAINAAEGGLIKGEKTIQGIVETRVFSAPDGKYGVFSQNAPATNWWREEKFEGQHTLPKNEFPGAVTPPEYIVEEIGNYISDGGSGIVSLDRGAGAYGRITGGGRQMVLYRLQSVGNGSSDKVKAVVESLYVQTN